MKIFAGGSPFVRLAAVAIVALGCVMGAVVAQDTEAKATYGEKELVTGFEPDPFVVKDVEAGGELKVKKDKLTQYVAKAPDFRLTYKAGDKFPLIIRVEAKGDTTLLVNAPDGKWYEDDDSGGNLNPKIIFDKPQSGRYEIWVGTLDQPTIKGAKLIITEVK